MKSSPDHSHAPFYELKYFRWAVGLAMSAGFTLGAHIAAVIGFDFPLGKTFYTYIQAHGHVQLMGWSGLFILGGIMYFQAQDSALSPALPQKKLILRLFVLALLLRFACDSVSPYLTETPALTLVNTLVVISAVLLCFASARFVPNLSHTLNQALQYSQSQLRQVFFQAMTLCGGWLVYISLNLALTLTRLVSKTTILDQNWNEVAVQIFVNFTLLPLAFGFSHRLFIENLDMRIGRAGGTKLLLLYAIAAALQIIPLLPPLAVLGGDWPVRISFAGMALKGGVILWGLLTVRRLWVSYPTSRSENWKPGRAKGETTVRGNRGLQLSRAIRRLVCAACLWLSFGAMLEVALGISSLVGAAPSIGSDAIRHIYLLGFVSQVIFVVAFSLIPETSGRKGALRLGLVTSSLWLVNLAAACRVLPLVLPDRIISAIPRGAVISQTMFGLSGVVAILAAACLAMFIRIHAPGTRQANYAVTDR